MEQQTPTNTQAELLLMWKAPSQPIVERSPRWYLIGGILVLLLTAYGILTGSWPFAIVMILLGAMYFLLRGHTPTDKSIAITTLGVQYETQSLRWNELSGFWFLTTPDYTELHLIFADGKKNDVIIQTGAQSIHDIREVLGAYIPEQTEKTERFVDMIIRICKL